MVTNGGGIHVQPDDKGISLIADDYWFSVTFENHDEVLKWCRDFIDKSALHFIPNSLKGEVHRKCSLCKVWLTSIQGHSTGTLHAVCPKCYTCPDCDDGAV